MIKKQIIKISTCSWYKPILSSFCNSVRTEKKEIPTLFTFSPEVYG